MKKNLLLIFVRHPELGKCKTRLAKTIGDQAALDIYTYLLRHTASIVKNSNADKQVWYAEEIVKDDLWDNAVFDKREQDGDDLGKRMAKAFRSGFQQGYQNIVIVGSDLFDLTEADIEAAFKALKTKDYVIGPAKDGGYYLLGMREFNPKPFQNKAWSTDTVFEDTLADLKNKNLTLLPERNDIDNYDDMKGIAELEKFIPS